MTFLTELTSFQTASKDDLGEMSNRKNVFLETGRGEYTGIHLMPFEEKARAEKHERNRQEVIVSILLHLHLLALEGYIKHNANLVLKGADEQNLKGSRTDKTAAAHCVPRQLLIDTRTPQDILLNPYTEHSAIPEQSYVLRLLFGQTDILPVNFNHADSRAEQNGLNEGFLKASRFVISASFDVANADANSILLVIRTAFSIYKAEAEIAFKRSKELIRQLLEPSFIFPAEKERYLQQMRITEVYAATLQESQTVIEMLTLHKIEALTKIYREK